MVSGLATTPEMLETFSILGRIGGDATKNCIVQPERVQVLSVSSVGSEAMQLRDDQRPLPGQEHFQYPRSDRRRCNSEEAPKRPVVRVDFQYPRSDRRRCNGRGVRAGRVPPRLSVSSVGSEAMQLVRLSSDPRPHTPFSILGRIGGDATWVVLPPGEFWLQIFQYPRSDRRRCNFGGDFQSGFFRRLSVSSVGSEAMQLGRSFSSAHLCRSFSILGRIGGDATKATGLIRIVA